VGETTSGHSCRPDRAGGQGDRELELPLLGGRLWEPAEAGRLDDRGWTALIVQRAHEYRERAADLRKQFAFVGAQPFQRFPYKEFVNAWKRAGR
jgi:hypothetical protein